MMGGMARTARPASIARFSRPKLMVGSQRLTHPALPARQVDAQGALDRLVGAHQVVIDPGPAGGGAQLLAEGVKVLAVLLAQPLRIDEQLVPGHLQVAELGPLLE